MAIRSSPGDDKCLFSTILTEQSHHILAILAEEPRPLTDRDLAVQLSGREEDKPITELSVDEIRRRLIELHHRYLPKLEALGWIDRHPEGIVLTDQVPSGDSEFGLPPRLDSEIQWDILSVLLPHSRRQKIVSVLAQQCQPLTLEELATEVKSDGQISGTMDESGCDLTLSAYLHHVDLPSLDEVGLINYDSTEKTITVGENLSNVVAWMDGNEIAEGCFETQQ